MSKIKLLASFVASVMLLQTTALALVNVTYQNKYQIGNDTYYSEVYGTTSSGSQSINIIEYMPNEDVSPVVVYGDTVRIGLTMAKAKAQLEAEGYNVIGGINGDFYDTSTGIPIGIMINNGEVICLGSWQQSLGFKADGSVVMGSAGISMKLTSQNGSIDIDYFNKVRTNSGVYLLNSNFSVLTRVSTAGTDIVFKKVDDSIVTAKGSISLKVSEIRTTNQSLPIADDEYVLTIADNITKDVTIPDFVVGEIVTLSTNVNYGVWSDVVVAIGGLDTLIENGKIASGLSTSVNPRTAIGIKADNTVVFYEVDGRSTSSAGLSLQQVAEELLALGCVQAINLDGGGSSAVMAQYPGTDSAVLTNTPSDGALRASANYIMLVNNAVKTNNLANIHLYLNNNLMLLNATVSASIKGTDLGFYPVSVSSNDFVLSSGNSSILQASGSSLIAKDYGTTQVTATHNGLTNSQEVTVLKEVDSISVKNQSSGASVSRIVLSPNSTYDLSATAVYRNFNVNSVDNSFNWSISSNVGTIDENGLIKAGDTHTSGTVTVSYGSKSVSIPIVVGLNSQEYIILDNDFENISTFDGFSVINDFSNVYSGNNSLKVANTSNKTTLQVNFNENISEAKYLNFYAKGVTSDFDVYFKDSSNKSIKTSVKANSSDAFSLYSIEIPSNATEFSYISFNKSDVVYLDNVVQTKNETDTKEPYVNINSYSTSSQMTLTGTIKDNDRYYLEKSDITMELNGNNIDFSYDILEGNFTTNSFNLSNGINRFSIIAKDKSGNITKKSVDLKYTASTNQVFNDISSLWSEDYINFTNSLGIVNGELLSNGEYAFNPNRNLTRAEFAVMFSRYLNLDTSKYTLSLDFADIDEIPSWALPHVIAVSEEGIMNGYYGDDGKLYFNATNNINRAEVVTSIGRVLDNAYQGNSINFSDKSSIPSWSYEHFEKLLALNIINGYEDNTVRPLNSITRAEVCKLIFSMY